MKTAIVTLVGNYNYGNRLQNYAMTQILQYLGHTVETLVFPQKPDVSLRHLKYKANVFLGRTKDPVKSMTPERLSRFHAFNANIPMRKTGSNYARLNNDYDFFVVGSDQVWNPEFLTDDRAYFLNFCEESKRIAIAASFGVETIPGKDQKRFKAGLMGIPHISTREESGLTIIQDLTGRSDAVCIIDPTLVLSGQDWHSVASYDFVPKEKYVFSYMLGSITESQKAFLKKYSHELAADVVLLSDRDDDSQLPAGPADFIGLIENASAVVTNSFHGAALSCLFQRPLFVMRRNGDDPTFSRIETLSNKLALGLEFDEHEAGVVARASYCHAESRLAYERENFFGFLKSSGLDYND